ncbi:MAG: hypothetical protein IT343_17635 [Candidatus Melainabacteria bacterium]|jgi:hypothetical protein|nr:hypothetical protein [Candidatus Melainabacteria bacterium]
MAKGTLASVLFVSSDAKAHMPPGSVNELITQAAALGIEVQEVDSQVDTGNTVEKARRSNTRIVGFFGYSEQDIPGIDAATKCGGLALTPGGSASLWCTRREGRSFPFGQHLEVRRPADAILAVQSAIAGG